MNLVDFFREHPKTAIAFSGGVDSSYLLYAAKKYGAEVKAYYVKSQFQPQFELEDALRLAGELNVPLDVTELDILSDEVIVSNPENRCYYCKRKIFETILEKAASDGFPVLLDGTNASDDINDRPGVKALRELSVLSPLRDCGLTKEQIRCESQKAGLFTCDKPAYACLATRIPTGDIITSEKLKSTEAAEKYLSSLGFSDFRVRYMNGAAKIQVPAAQIQKVVESREEITENLKQYYSAVLLDLEVR